MDDKKQTLEEEIGRLLEELDSLRMSHTPDRDRMETIEKRLTGKIGLLTSLNLKDTNTNLSTIIRSLNGLYGGLSQLNKSIKDGIDSNNELTKQTKAYNESIRRWTRVLAGATVFLVIVGWWQGCLVRTNTVSSQTLSKVAQEQLDLQLQPALIINTQGMVGAPSKYIELINIGNGAALNIKISCENPNLVFIRIPNYLEPRISKPLHFVRNIKAAELSKMPWQELERKATNWVSFEENEGVKELKIRLDYENVNNKKYFTELIVSNERVSLLSRGEAESK